MVSHICVGTPLLGWFEADVKRIIAYVLVSLMMTVACTSIFTLIAMLCSNKAYSVAGCILLIFFLLFMGIRITSALNGQVDYMYGEALYKPEMKEGNPIRLYSLDEITEIFGKLGLRICNSFADFSGKPSSDNDIQLMVYSIRE